MTIKEIKEYISNYPDDIECMVEYSKNTCTGHGPDEYCYCPYKDVRETIDYICEEKMEVTGDKKLKSKVLIFKIC